MAHLVNEVSTIDINHHARNEAGVLRAKERNKVSNICWLAKPDNRDLPYQLGHVLNYIRLDWDCVENGVSCLIASGAGGKV